MLIEELAIKKLKVILMGNEDMTQFGKYILNILSINIRRNAITDNIVSRQNMSEPTIEALRKNGFKIKVNKRKRG